MFNSCESLNFKVVTESTHISNYEIYSIHLKTFKWNFRNISLNQGMTSINKVSTIDSTPY